MLRAAGETETMQENICLWVLTNRNIKGEEKNAGYYASDYLPALMSEEAPVYVADIHDPRNAAGLKYGAGGVYAYPVDPGYRAGTRAGYKKRAEALDASQVSVVVPYTSSEVDPDILRSLPRLFPHAGFIGNPESLVDLNSKTCLKAIREDPAAAGFARFILPVEEIDSPESYRSLKRRWPDLVVKVAASTEGGGVYVDLKNGSELDRAGGIEGLLATGQTLVGTPYDSPGADGDTRIYGYGDDINGYTVLECGAKRVAVAPDPQNPHPKCNVAAGASCHVVPIPEWVRCVVRDVAKYYSNRGIPHIGLDMFHCGANKESMRISEVNCSPDGHSYVKKEYTRKVADFYTRKYRQLIGGRTNG